MTSADVYNVSVQILRHVMDDSVVILLETENPDHRDNKEVYTPVFILFLIKGNYSKETPITYH